MAITSYVWSPIVWHSGENTLCQRVSSNFEASHFLAIDVDDGLTIEESLKFLREHQIGHVLATTKSHGIPKGSSPSRDRFRVVMRWDRPIVTLDNYQYNVKKAVRQWEADSSATDGARMFQPCTRIISAASGMPIPVKDKPPVSFEVNYTLQKWRERRASGQPKPFALEFCERGRLDKSGGRKRTIYSVACELAQAGWSEGEIERAIKNAPINWEGITHTIVAGAIKSAIARFHGRH